MEKLNNYWYNPYINQNAIIEFLHENDIEYNYFDYNDFLIIGFIINILRSDIKEFHYKLFENKKYVLLLNSLILKQLPILKKSMLNKRIAKLENKKIIYRKFEGEGDNFRYLSINTKLLDKWLHSVDATEHFKNKQPERYENVIKDYKNKYTEKEINNILELFNAARLQNEKSNNINDIETGLVNYLKKWDNEKYK